MTWLPVVGFPRYEVSSEGEIRSGKHILKPRPNSNGYLYLTLYREGERHTKRVHLLVAEAFYGQRPPGMVSRHLNGVRTDNRAENLAWGTYRDNVLDAVTHGTQKESRKTRCPVGHEYTAENTRISNGSRHCRTCDQSFIERRSQMRRQRRLAAANKAEEGQR